MPRLATITVATLIIYALAHAHITLPALTVVGLIAWAVASSAIAVALARRGRHTSPERTSRDR